VTVPGRGNLVRQAIGLLVHFPSAATAVGDVEGLAEVDRPGVPLLVELLSQLREEPPANTAALLERWRDRPDHGPLSKLATSECLVLDEQAAAAEIRSAVERLVADDAERRLDLLQEKAREAPLTPDEKQEIQSLIRALGQSARRGTAK
jgi:DNA primase